MHREALTLELGSLGVPVVPWDGVGDLTGALQHAMRASRPAPGTRVRSGVSTGPGGAR
jgi:hypothetical protein